MAGTALPTDDELAAAGLRLAVEERPQGGIARITLARPERHNAMTDRTWTALAHVGHALPASVRIVVIDGEGPSFSSGIDTAMFAPGNEDSALNRFIRDPAGRADLDAAIAGYQEGFLWLRRPGIVSVAAVHGHAIGAGFQLALACDLRILSDDADLCMKEPALGLVPDLTGTKPLVDIVGVNRALELCLTTRTVGAQEARELRLAELVVPGDQLAGAVDDLVTALLETPRDAAAATKELLLGAPGRTLEEQAAAERAAQVERFAAWAAAAGRS
ncbi:enoyl-CoA hydratase/isomerase family protein [Streptomonospora sp. S1-112]|uniref:Enoyl-CoA hydratase/isomerase family protein n=1 Tax=Streptomonospora mangrovi TaxID=2883123 RepID=A0A9X3SJC5_9ACTN|nr:enoyl-CoA hydratase/isomerase family protein [Streptomonospora mangrovi]MDA0567209.1 enoyl-CoA hydratase/isomerase family protein [Streptomonospora mangrovi]